MTRVMLTANCVYSAQILFVTKLIFRTRMVVNKGVMQYASNPDRALAKGEEVLFGPIRLKPGFFIDGLSV